MFFFLLLFGIERKHYNITQSQHKNMLSSNNTLPIEHTHVECNMMQTSIQEGFTLNCFNLKPNMIANFYYFFLLNRFF